MGIEVGVDGAHVAPAVAVAVRGAGYLIARKVVDECFTPTHEIWDDVAAHVVVGAFLEASYSGGGHQGVGVEDVVAHGGQELGGVSCESRC